MTNKFILKSKTIQGALIVLLPSLAVLFGFTFTEDDSALVTTTTDAMIQLLGGLYAIYGRLVTEGEKLNVKKS